MDELERCFGKTIEVSFCDEFSWGFHGSSRFLPGKNRLKQVK
jgi:hypothetical protein